MFLLNDIQIGRYLPGDSFLHRMDPRVKLVLLFFFLLLIFFVDNAAGFAALTFSVVLLMIFSAVPIGMQLRSIRPILWIVLFTFGVHLFMTPGTELFRAGPITAHPSQHPADADNESTASDGRSGGAALAAAPRARASA